MTQLVLTLVLIFIVYLIGYAVGRKEIVDDIKQITNELNDATEDADDI